MEVSVKRESTVLMINLPAVHLGMASQAPPKNLKKQEEKFVIGYRLDPKELT